MDKNMARIRELTHKLNGLGEPMSRGFKDGDSDFVRGYQGTVDINNIESARMFLIGAVNRVLGASEIGHDVMFCFGNKNSIKEFKLYLQNDKLYLQNNKSKEAKGDAILKMILRCVRQESTSTTDIIDVAYYLGDYDTLRPLYDEPSSTQVSIPYLAITESTEGTE